jgi:mRNA interferase MazF
VRRGEIYRSRERVPERGGKPGFYVIVSRSFIAENDDVSTVVCAPVYGGVLGLSTEVVVGVDEGLPRTSSIRCDFLTLMFKTRLTGFVSTLGLDKRKELNRALLTALELSAAPSEGRKASPIRPHRSSR